MPKIDLIHPVDGFDTNSDLPFHIIMNQRIIWNMQDNT